MKAAYHDPNPVVMLEHKGNKVFWSWESSGALLASGMPKCKETKPFGAGNVPPRSARQVPLCVPTFVVAGDQPGARARDDLADLPVPYLPRFAWWANP